MPRKKKPKPDPEPVFESFIEEEERQPEDELTVFRDVMSQNDDERNEEKDMFSVDKLVMKPPPQMIWTDNPEYNRFKTGDLVITRKAKRGETVPVYRISGPSTDVDTWDARRSGDRDSIVIEGWKYKKAPKNAKWFPYEDPYTKWKREQEEKNRK